MPLPSGITTGTVYVASGATIVHGLGVNWDDVRDGDRIDFAGVNGQQIQSVASTAGGWDATLYLPWSGATILLADAVPYVIQKTAISRYSAASLAAGVTNLFRRIQAAPLFWILADDRTEPDPQDGEDGHFTIDLDPAPQAYWLKSAGVWVPQGSFATLNPRGEWNNADTFFARDIVTLNGSAYIGRRQNVNSMPVPEGSDDWQLLTQGVDATFMSDITALQDLAAASATAAASSATTASGAATTASGAATTAGGAATTATTQAGIATGAATTASGAATTATTQAGIATSAASDASDRLSDVTTIRDDVSGIESDITATASGAVSDINTAVASIGTSVSDASASATTAVGAASDAADARDAAQAIVDAAEQVYLEVLDDGDFQSGDTGDVIDDGDYQ